MSSKNNIHIKNATELNQVQAILEKVNNKIAPLWSLENYVAVNPFWGFKQESFEDTNAYFSKISNQRLTMNKSFYLKAFDEGKILKEDIKLSLKNSTQFSSVEHFLEATYSLIESDEKVLLIQEIISEKTKTDWSKFITNRITNWAASYFDKSSTVWKTNNPTIIPLDSWKLEAQNDFSPLIMGIKNFKETLSLLKDLNTLETISYIKKEFQLNDDSFENYTHALCLKVNGWSS